MTATANPDGTVLLSWSAPDDLGLLPLSGYTITDYDSGGAAVAQTTLPYATTSYTVAGLEEGDSYRYGPVRQGDHCRRHPNDQRYRRHRATGGTALPSARCHQHVHAAIGRFGSATSSTVTLTVT